MVTLKLNYKEPVLNPLDSVEIIHEDIKLSFAELDYNPGEIMISIDIDTYRGRAFTLPRENVEELIKALKLLITQEGQEPTKGD